MVVGIVSLWIVTAYRSCKGLLMTQHSGHVIESYNRNMGGGFNRSVMMGYSQLKYFTRALVKVEVAF